MIKEVSAIISQILGHSDFNDDSKVLNIGGWDSLNHLRIIIEINEQLGKNLDPADIHSTDSISDIMELLSED